MVDMWNIVKQYSNQEEVDVIFRMCLNRRDTFNQKIWNTVEEVIFWKCNHCFFRSLLLAFLNLQLWAKYSSLLATSFFIIFVMNISFLEIKFLNSVDQRS